MYECNNTKDKGKVEGGETDGAGQNSDQQFPEPVPTAAHRNKRPLLSPDVSEFIFNFDSFWKFSFPVDHYVGLLGGWSFIISY